MAAAQTPSLSDTVTDLEDYLPTVPDEVTQHILQLNGTQLEDPRLVRLVSLAAQRFLDSVVHDTLQVQKRKGSNWRQKELGYNTKDTRTVLTTEDLTIALEEVHICCAAQYGVKAGGPAYFADANRQ